MSGYHDDLARQLARRNAALKSVSAAFENAGSSVKNEVERIEKGLKIDNAIAEHPWIAAGVALGAGLIVSRLLRSSVPAATATPHVIVEVRNNGSEVTAKEAAPVRRSPVDYIMQAVAGFEAVQGILKQVHDAKRNRADATSEPAAAEPEPAPEPETPPAPAAQA